MGSGKSGQQIAQENLQCSREWVKERHKANDWSDYARRDQLSRSEIAQECGFALSVLRQNPAVKSDLASLEERLRTQPILDTSRRDKTLLMRRISNLNKRPPSEY